MGKDKAIKAANQGGGPMGFVLFVAWFGALVYFVNQASGFGEMLVAFVKACVWPAIVLYHVLDLLAV